MTLSNLRAYLQIKRVAQLLVTALMLSVSLVGIQAVPASAAAQTICFPDSSNNFLSRPTGMTNLPTTGPYVIEAWVKMSSTTNGVKYGLAGWGDGATSRTNSFAVFGAQLTNWWYANDLVTTGSNLSAGTWYHVAAQWDGTTRTMYRNGVLVASAPASGLNASNFATFKVGGYNNEHFRGCMNNLRIVRDQIVYTGNFTPPSRLEATQTGNGTTINAIGAGKTVLLLNHPTDFTRDGSTYGNHLTASSVNVTSSTDGPALPSYAITFNANGGTGTQTASSWTESAAATSLPVTSTFTRAGHTFAGWASTSTSTTPVLTYATEAPATFYAIWTRNAYSVTFNKNADSATGTMAIETRSATTALPLNTFTWDANNTFLGWNTAANGSGTNYSDGQNYLYVASTTLYARWGNTISYSSVGAESGSPSRSSDSWVSGAISLPTVGTMVKPGYTFGGWSDGTTTFTTTYTPTTGITLNPVWTGQTFTVSYKPNGGTGSVPANQTWVVGTTPLTLSGNTGPLTRPGYEFLGWSTNSKSLTGATTFSPTLGRTLVPFNYFALWSPIPYTVSYVLNGGTSTLPTEASKRISETFTVASAPTQAGFIFGGWSNGSTIYSAGSSYTVGSSNITLTAQWIPLFTVSYLLNGSLDTPTANSTVAGGTLVTLAAAPTRTGYNFTGWLGNAETTTRAAGSSFTVVEDSTLRAAWTPLDYTVTYALNSGTSVLPTESAKNIGDEFAVAATPTRAGYTFNGWWDGFNTYGAESSYTVGTAPISLTALWAPIDYTVTYDLGGGVGTLPTKSDVTIGTTFTVSTEADPTYLAHTFLGWSDGDNLYAKTATYTAGARDITLTATWVLNGYTRISYALGAGASGTLPTQASLLEGSNFTVASGSALSNPNKAFVGWFDGTDTITAGSSYYVGPESSPIVLTAVWDTGYGATYLAGSGTGTAPVDSVLRVSGASFTLSGVGSLTKSGYTFAGWNDGTTTFQTGATYTLASADVTFTAQWNVVVQSAPVEVQAPVVLPIAPVKEEKKEPVRLVVTAKTTAAESSLVAQAFTATSNNTAIEKLFAPPATPPTPAQSAAGARVVAIENVRVIDSSTAFNNIVLVTTSSTPAVVTISLQEPVISDQVTEALRKKVTVVATTAGFTVTPVAGFTGAVVVPIIATIEGVQTVVYNRVVVSPEAPAPQSFAPVTIGQSAIAWSSTPSQVVNYQVAVNNKVVCTTTATSCSVSALIGPNSKVTLVAVGNDATESAPQVVPYVAKAPIPALKVNFATGSAVLTTAQKVEITAIAKVIKSEGFTRLVVNGFTDSRGSAALNAALSKARANSVVAYIKKLLPTVAVKAGAKGSANPVASNTSANGQAENRRTEIATW